MVSFSRRKCVSLSLDCVYTCLYVEYQHTFPFDLKERHFCLVAVNSIPFFISYFANLNEWKKNTWIQDERMWNRVNERICTSFFFVFMFQCECIVDNKEFGKLSLRRLEQLYAVGLHFQLKVACGCRVSVFFSLYLLRDSEREKMARVQWTTRKILTIRSILHNIHRDIQTHTDTQLKRINAMWWLLNWFAQTHYHQWQLSILIFFVYSYNGVICNVIFFNTLTMYIKKVDNQSIDAQTFQSTN